MNTLHIGSLALPLGTALLLLGVVSALVIAAILARKNRVPTVDAVWTLILVGFVFSRLVFVLHYLPQYLADPLSIIDIRDHGFSLIGGLVAVVVYCLWIVWRRPALRASLLPAVIAGLAVWGGCGAAFHLMNTTRLMLPDVTLTRLDGNQLNLQHLKKTQAGKPMVINLWATWCPPCRAEMPTLTAAQKQHPAVVFVLANQGESAATVRQFLHAESIAPGNVVLDGNRQLADATRARVFPTTLFFNTQGELVNRHVGMLSPATLARALDRLLTQSRQSQPANNHPARAKHGA